MNPFKDFHKVKNLHFDILKLKQGLNEVLKIKNYDNANGIKNFAAICLNQIPGKPESTQGNFARGIYWTKPDHKGKEAPRDTMLDETLYTEFVKEYENTYLSNEEKRFSAPALIC